MTLNYTPCSYKLSGQDEFSELKSETHDSLAVVTQNL